MRILKYDEAISLFTEIRFLIKSHPEDEDLKGSYRHFIDICLEYADIRAKWSTWDRDTKVARDEERTLYHDSVVSEVKLLQSFNTLYGNPVDFSCIESVDPYEQRKLQGDLACFVHLILSIEAR